MQKNYTIEILFDNGVIEHFLTAEGTKEEMEQLQDYLNKAIKNEAKGTFTMEDAKGNEANINISKITRYTII
jgi:ABC-type phosphate transport system auxiliary subunit